MKSSALIVLLAVITAVALLVACQPEPAPDDVADTPETDACMECHSGDTDIGNALLAAQDQYDESGHLNGPRMLDPYESTTGHIYVAHGSNAMYTNGSAGPTNCSKCHSHQGFVDFVTTGAADSYYSAASPPGCFTCHEPHESGNFTTRKTSSETLVDGITVFDGGAGNLCVTCHKSLTSSTSFLTGFPKAWTSSNGPHHGPQADFLMGVNHYAYPAKTYVGQSSHLGTGTPDSCVSCHMYGPSSRLGGTLQLGGHGMYLTGDVHGTITNVIGAQLSGPPVVKELCRSCHTWSGTSATVAVPLPAAGIGFLTGGYETSTDVNSRLDDIRGNRDLLIGYFGDGTANFGGDGKGPIQKVNSVEAADTDGDDQTTGEWGKDWEFAAATLTETQSYAFWNFRFFIEDKSEGIHNPKFAHQILYDAVVALSMTPVGLPPDRP